VIRRLAAYRESDPITSRPRVSANEAEVPVTGKEVGVVVGMSVASTGMVDGAAVGVADGDKSAIEVSAKARLAGAKQKVRRPTKVRNRRMREVSYSTIK
jgi:hypothetical protein